MNSNKTAIESPLNNIGAVCGNVIVLSSANLALADKILASPQEYRGFCFIVIGCSKWKWFSRFNRVILDMMKIHSHTNWSLIFTRDYEDLDKLVRAYVIKYP